MKQILLATHNQGKINRYKKFLSSPNYVFVTLDELNINNFGEPAETGTTEAENAALKAGGYFDFVVKSSSQNLPIECFAEDSGFYILGLADEEQPGKNVKGKAGITPELDGSLSKEEKFNLMTDYYIQIANRFGGEVQAYFLDAYCLFGTENVAQVEAKRMLTLTNKIHQIDYDFPLCSLYLVDGVPYHQLTDFQMEQFLEPSLAVARQLLAH